MKDNKNLYFIPILTKAFDSDDRESAYKDALSEIIELGKMPEYQKGFEQFTLFIASGIQNLKEDSDVFNKYKDKILDRLMIEVVSETFYGPSEIKRSLLKHIQSNPKIMQRLQEIKRDIEIERELGPSLQIELYFDDKLSDSLVPPTKSESIYFTKIIPGTYSVRLSNGRVLWEGMVEEKDVIWKTAFPDIDYPMAAATENEERSQTKSLNILDGEMELAFHAGLEAGRISITLKET